jgi:acetoin utilization deacetylase AcuC-like enzyme
VIKQFNPHLILVSAGFDQLRGDPLGQLSVSQDALCYFSEELKKLSPNGKIVSVLEGGYNPKVMSRAVESVVRVSIFILFLVEINLILDFHW